MATATNDQGRSSGSNGSENKTSSGDINILLLGETGVGKSTFINAFANYLTFGNLPEGDNKNLLSLIPTSFTMYDHNGEERKIQFGEETNDETFKEGESATRSPACYEFPLGERTVRIIDTPGIGDTRGIKQDNINFEGILNFISAFENLHCICFLLKPNNARLTITFDFCIKQLLCHLQKDASKNIVFVFTNSRGSFYNSGETGPILAKMLKSIEDSPPNVKIRYDSSTRYCLDNESFRFLMAVKSGMTFNENTKREFSASWDHSVKECQRLMKYIIGYPEENILPLPPHKIKDTVSLNTARRMILELQDPLAQIMDNISRNLDSLQKKRKEIEDNSRDIKSLEGKLHITTFSLQIQPLDRPHTICTAAKCCDIKVTDGTNYYVPKKICCIECTVMGNTGEVIGSSMLWFCEAINMFGICKVCGCSYTVHKHNYYGVKEVSKRIIDNKVESQMNAKVEGSEKIKQFLQQCQEVINKYNKEKEFVTTAMAEFACFLKANAIVSYNDAFKKYLEYKIENLETVKEKGVVNKNEINNYRQMIKDYQAQITQLDKCMKSDEANKSAAASSKKLSTDYIFEVIEKLKGLECSGTSIAAMQKAQHNGMEGMVMRRSTAVATPKDNTVFNFTNQKNENSSKQGTSKWWNFAGIKLF